MIIALASQFHVYLPWRGVNVRLTKCLNIVLNVKALVDAFNQKKALVEWPFSWLRTFGWTFVSSSSSAPLDSPGCRTPRWRWRCSSGWAGTRWRPAGRGCPGWRSGWPPPPSAPRRPPTTGPGPSRTPAQSPHRSCVVVQQFSFVLTFIQEPRHVPAEPSSTPIRRPWHGGGVKWRQYLQLPDVKHFKCANSELSIIFSSLEWISILCAGCWRLPVHFKGILFCFDLSSGRCASSSLQNYHFISTTRPSQEITTPSRSDALRMLEYFFSAQRRQIVDN